MDDVYPVNFVSLILENSHSEKPPILHHPTRRPRHCLAFSKCHLDMGARSRHEKQPKESGERAKAAEAGGVPFESIGPRGHWPRAAQRQLQAHSAEYKLCGEKGGYGAKGMASSPPPRGMPRGPSHGPTQFSMRGGGHGLPQPGCFLLLLLKLCT